MESISTSSHIYLHHRNLISLRLSFNPSIISFPYRFDTLHQPRFCALKTSRSSNSSSSKGSSSQQDDAANVSFNLLRKPVVEVKKDAVDSPEEEEEEESYDEDEEESIGEERWVDLEDQILEDTVPLVGFVRMILHSGKYISGERLTPEHQKTILERLLPYHPESEKKIGCGVDYITVDYHPDFEGSRCLFIVRRDGVKVDFSYWKCIKGLIRKNYPLYADSFILRHFRQRSNAEGR